MELHGPSKSPVAAIATIRTWLDTQPAALSESRPTRVSSRPDPDRIQ
jgi:hypothetical protein